MLAGVLGVAAVMLPALASSETTPTITAENVGGGPYGAEHHWTPATATIAANGIVTLSNPTEVDHGVEWFNTPGGVKPACSGVPVGTTPSASGTKWSGTCTFTQPGVYTFYCTVHGPEMTGRITVSATGTVTTTMSTPTSTAGAQPTSTTPPTATTPALAPLTLGSPFAGSASAAIKLPSTERGASVHGSVAVSAAGAGGRLAIELLAGRASLAGAARAARATVEVGSSLRSSLRAGLLSFSVALDRRARRALHRAHRLALTVRIELTPAQGAAITADRSVLLRA